MNVDVLYRDRELVAVHKPVGWESVVRAGSGRCLARHLRSALQLDDLQPAHRLDRATSGVQLYGTSSEWTRRLHSQFERRAVQKRYLGLCLGVPLRFAGDSRARLSRGGGGRRRVRVVRGRGGVSAHTSFRRVAPQDDEAAPAITGLPVSLLLFEPTEGRTHQIRVHAAELGHPLAGDGQYGDPEANSRLAIGRLALHCWSLALDHPATGAPLVLEAAFPEDLTRPLDRLVPGWRQALSVVAAPPPS